jgi:hypothetical protein
MHQMAAFVAIVLLPAAIAAGQTSATSWLDRPLSNWNKVTSLPNAPQPHEAHAQLINRCKVETREFTPAWDRLKDAGWVPFLHMDRQLTLADIEIVDGMNGADGMCRPAPFNVFVFVGGRFAGTLSPEPMTSRLDGSVGAVRIVSAETITAEFARYGPQDPLCCPSSRATVDFRVDRTGPTVFVMPVEIRTTRGNSKP